MARVLVVGSLNMDLIVRAPRRPAPGETVLGDEFRILPGGKGLNQAVAAARLGAATSLAGAVGDDDFGRRLLDLLDSERIDRQHVRLLPGIATGVAVISVAAGDNAIIVASGANMRLVPQDIDGLPCQAGDICVGQLEVPLDVTAAAFRRAREAGGHTILNAAPAQILPSALLDATDTLVVNELELASLSGAAVSDASSTDELAAAAGPLLGAARTVIATLGARGVIAIDRTGVHAVPGRTVPVLDTTGAGDCFVGALAAALAAGADRGQALQHANDAAALSVQRHGAAPAMPTLDEVRRGHLMTA